MAWWTNRLEERCWNHHDKWTALFKPTPMNNSHVDSPGCNNMLKHDWTMLLFYQSCPIMLAVLSHGCWATNPVIYSLWYFYSCIPGEAMLLMTQSCKINTIGPSAVEWIIIIFHLESVIFTTYHTQGTHTPVYIFLLYEFSFMPAASIVN